MDRDKKNQRRGLLEHAIKHDEATRPNYRAIIIRFRDDLAQVFAAGYKFKIARECLHVILAEEALEEGRKPITLTPETFRKWCVAEGLSLKPKWSSAMAEQSTQIEKSPELLGQNSENSHLMPSSDSCSEPGSTCQQASP